MQTISNTVNQPAQASFIEKKSEFIGNAAYVTDMDEALAFVDEVRDLHPKSRHVAFASICVATAEDVLSYEQRMSDDGEPSGTAGKPMFEVLRHQDMVNVVVTVTRYFGGILLGAGGLVRAYAHAATLALQAANTIPIVQYAHCSAKMSYADFSPFHAIIAQCGGRITSQDFQSDVIVECLVPKEVFEQCSRTLIERFQATISLECIDYIWDAV